MGCQMHAKQQCLPNRIIYDFQLKVIRPKSLQNLIISSFELFELNISYAIIKSNSYIIFISLHVKI